MNLATRRSAVGAGRNMTGACRGLATIAAALIVVTAASLAHGAYRPIYGGPARGAGSSGYDTDFQYGGPSPGNGVTAGSVSRRDGTGFAAFRWDASGAPPVELAGLGVDASGFTQIFVDDTNAAGTAVGGSAVSVAGSGIDLGFRAVRWQAGTTAATPLGHLGVRSDGFTASHATLINDAGTTFGTATRWGPQDQNLGERLVRWDAGSTNAVELGNAGTLPGGITGGNLVLAVNDAGTAAGYLTVPGTAGASNDERAARWDAGATVASILQGLSNTTSTEQDYPFNINAAGTVVGSSQKNVPGDSGVRAVRWNAGGTTPVELGHLGRDSDGFTGAAAYDINDAGVIVGAAQKFTNGFAVGTRAVRWDAGGTAATELGTLGNGFFGVTQTAAFGINSAGLIIGTAEKYAPNLQYIGDRAVLWGADNVAVELQSLIDPNSGWTQLYEVTEVDSLSEFGGITDSNWVTGKGVFDPDGPGGEAAYVRMFLMQVPEPSGLAVASSAAALLLRRRPRPGRPR